MLPSSTFAALEAPDKLRQYKLRQTDKDSWVNSSPRMKMVLWLVSKNIYGVKDYCNGEIGFFQILELLVENGFDDIPSIAGVGVYGNLTVKKLADEPYNMTEGAANKLKVLMKEAQKLQLKDDFDMFLRKYHMINRTKPDANSGLNCSNWIVENLREKK